MRKYLALLLLAGVAAGAAADPESLLEMRTRPTIADLEREASIEQFPNNPFAKPVFVPPSQLKSIAIYARVVAELEWAYPGGIYMPLGRDVVMFGDILDAFYRSLGQPGRVIRLNASGPTVKGATPAQLARFVEDSGVNLANGVNGPTYVFFDGSNYHPQSQSCTILDAVYSQGAANGASKEDLVGKFAFFNLYRASGTTEIVAPGLDREDFLRRQRISVRDQGIPAKVFTTLSFDYWHSEWHDSFGLLRENPDGTLQAHVPPPASEDWRRYILYEMRVVMEMVRSPEFLRLVRQRARELGYDFDSRFEGECAGSLRAL